jgi:hypothetical protein
MNLDTLHHHQSESKHGFPAISVHHKRDERPISLLACGALPGKEGKSRLWQLAPKWILVLTGQSFGQSSFSPSDLTTGAHSATSAANI